MHLDVPPDVLSAFLRIGVAGAAGGLVGGFFAGGDRRMFGAVLLGIIGGISVAAILRIAGVKPVVDAGQGFSVVFGLGGGFLLSLVVGASNR